MQTLAFHKSRPLTSAVKLADVPANVVFGKIPGFVQANKKVAPEVSALKFYMMNHAWGVIHLRNVPTAPLGKDEAVAEMYHSAQHGEAVRMFYYLLLICTRETRHAGKDQKKNEVMADFPKFKSYHSNYVNDTSNHELLTSMCLNVPDATLGEYTDWLVIMFMKCHYSSGFGGKAWGKVAKVLRDFVHGVITAEMMLDTAFTLAHNNGPIFNKGMLYDMYQGSEFIKILDIQAAGQIPQYICEGTSTFHMGVSNDYAKLRELVGDEFAGSVDWDEVNKGAKGGHYGGSKKTKNKLNIPEFVAPIDPTAPKGMIEILPNEFVQKITRNGVAVNE